MNLSEPLRRSTQKPLGLSNNVKIAAGAGDNAAAAIGTGTVSDGDCNISLGTSGTVFISKDAFGTDGQNALHSFAHANGKYHLMGCMLSAASCNKWWCENILKTSDYAAEQQGNLKLGENPVIFLPYLMGERSPHNNPTQEVFFFGMSMDTTRQDMTLSMLEGVAFALNDSIEAAKSTGAVVTSAKICGGGAKKPPLEADNRRRHGALHRNRRIGGGSRSRAAMLAAVGCGAFDSVTKAAQSIVRVVSTTRPDPEAVEKYKEKYQKFRELYPALKNLF